MLAGLIFAVQDADDRPGTLAATLPFAGMTVIEYQARLLIAAGVSQIVVVVARLTPELLGAVARIGRRGVAVDTVRNAGEAASRMHPLSHLVVLADGLVTTQDTLLPLAREEGDALLVVPEEEATTGFELLGGGDAWAGIARLDGRRLAEVAAMPHDYDVQSALLHVAAQAGATRVVLPQGDRRTGHGIERRRETLEARSRAVVNATLAARSGWFNRWVVRPVARVALPSLMRRHVPTVLLAGVAGAVGAGGLLGIWSDQLTVGLLLALASVIVAAVASSFAWLRDETGVSRLMATMALAIPALAALLLGRTIDAETGEVMALVVALAFVVIGGLGERAAGAVRPVGWGEPPAYLVVLAMGTILGLPFLALSAATVYATVTAVLAIERLRARV